ncbi:hypothetical protein ACFWCF_01515 [Rhodococcus sp. NPDC060090]|uniref:hypothetical protein n=1 Tax=Rhodococcus sp. NPDC060090 TaxID=3347056 RepID=UPI003667D826
MPYAVPPTDPNIRLEINAYAPTALQDVGIAYWRLEGLEPETGEPIWEQSLSALPYKMWSGGAHYAAAAAVAATLLGYWCASCRGELVLTSRQALVDALVGKAVECRRCNTRVDDQAAGILNPRALTGHSHRALEARGQATIEQARREVIAELHPVAFEDPEQLLADASLQAKLGALAVIHAVGNTGGLIYPIEINDRTIAPNASLSKDLFIAAWQGGLLQVHPTSPTNAFSWDGETVLGEGFYTNRARFFVPGDGPVEERPERLVDLLLDRLDPTRMRSTERTELTDLVRHLIAEEASRYFVHMLGEHNLPDLTETQEDALRTATARGAELFSIGHLDRMVWGSIRDTAGVHQRNAGMPKANAITYGLKQFERWIEGASEKPSVLSDPFSEDERNLPLSSATGIVFRTILDLDPMSAGPGELAEALVGASDAELRHECDASIPDHDELMEWLRTSPGYWNDGKFRKVLGLLEGWTPQICAPGCAHERIGHVAQECGRVYDRIVSSVGDTDAAILTAEATVIANALDDGVRAGDGLLTSLVQTLQDYDARQSNEF